MTEPASAPTGVAIGFETAGVIVPLNALTPLKPLRDDIKQSAKYRQIVTSVRAVGLVEPPVVIPDASLPGTYYLLDGHLRVEALRDLGVEEVECILSRDDEAFTYNKRINRLSASQEHRMIKRALDRGVSEERLAEALGLAVCTVQRRAKLMDGIFPETVELLKETPCPSGVFGILRRMSPLRQREAAELMVGNNNFSVAFATALLAATHESQLAPGHRAKPVAAVTRDQISRLERELATLQMQVNSVDESYGLDNLHLTVARSYLARLLTNARVVRWLAQHRPEYLAEFQAITELTRLPIDGSMEAAG